MSTSTTFPSFWQRTWHQWRCDLRRDCWLLVLWLLLLAVQVLEHWDVQHVAMRGAFIPALLPAAAGLLLAWRLVRADHPRSADAAVLTRPVGREALWLAKALMVLFAGLLPWCLAHAMEWRGFGLSTLMWGGVLIQIALPAVVSVFIVSWIASLSMSRGVFIAVMVLAALVMLMTSVSHFASDYADLMLGGGFSFQTLLEGNDLNRCRLVIGLSAAALTLLLGWWCAGRGKSSVAVVSVLLLFSGLLAVFWPWNWRKLTPQNYAKASLNLHFGSTPQEEHQSLWRTLHLSGLAADEVASIVSLAPIRPDEEEWPHPRSYSDFSYIDDGDDQVHAPWRWMKVDHVLKLSEHFPPTTTWIGEDDDTRTPLREILQDEQKRSALPAEARWRLRLAIHRLQRVFEMPLSQLLKQRVQASPTPGRMFDLVTSKMTESSIRLKAYLRQRTPLTVPGAAFAPLRHNGGPPTRNLLLTVHSPLIEQVICVHESTTGWHYQDTFWKAEHHRPIEFDLPLPIIHRTLAGLKIADWLQDARVTLWWPEERGIVVLELTPEQMDQVLAEPVRKEVKP
jgi:hypothetical protein